MLVSSAILFLLSGCITLATEPNTCKEEDECPLQREEGLIDLSLNEMEQDDPRLVQILKEKYLLPPPDRKKNKLNLTGKGSNTMFEGQFGQPMAVDEIYKGKKRDGFFIEAGAYDGEALSNTLFFEMKRNWTGLLVEANPDFFSQLVKKNRNAHLFPHCLSTVTRPEVVHFDASALIGGIVQEGRIKPGDIGRSPDYVNRPYNRRTIRMQCFPLYSLLLALGNPKVDYFSLDIEGAEFPVLKTVPWNKVDIRVVDVEFNHLGKVFDGSEEEVTKFLEENGFDFHGKVGIDALFVKRKKNSSAKKSSKDKKSKKQK